MAVRALCTDGRIGGSLEEIRAGQTVTVHINKYMSGFPMKHPMFPMLSDTHQSGWIDCRYTEEVEEAVRA